MSKYELVNDQFKDRWINKPNNKGDVGDLQDITDELNRLSSERDEAREQIDNIRKMLSESGEAVGNGEHDYSIIDMIENLIKSKDYFVRKSDSLERERAEAREETPCPHCETESYSQDERDYWKCGTIRYEEKCVVRTDLCNEREERKAAESKLAEAREQNAKLRDIAEWFANQFFENDGDERWPSCPVTKKAQSLCAELNQLKQEGAK